MSRYYSKTKGQIPKKLYIHQFVSKIHPDFGSILGPYFSKVKLEDNYERIEYVLDKETGDYLRNPPLVPRTKGIKKKLDI